MTRTASTTIGAHEVTILTDGALSFPPEAFPGTAAGTITDLLAEAGQSEIRTNFNAALIRGAGRTVLVDAGPRDLFGPGAGHLPDALAETGCPPASIETLFVTHLHPDHIAGAVTAEGAAVFAGAELVMTATEHAFWTDDANFANADETLGQWRGLALQLLAAYEPRLRLIGDDAAIFPGLTALPLPGHTPGHSGWRLESDGTQLVHVGDIVHAPYLQFADPGIGIVFDVDPDTARATRRRMLDEAAADGLLLTGGHLLQPALGRVERSGNGYRLVQDH